MTVSLKAAQNGYRFTVKGKKLDLTALDVDRGDPKSRDLTVAFDRQKEDLRLTGTLNVGPRIMMSRAGFDRTGLMQPGSRASQRFLFRLPESGLDIAELRRVLQRAFPDAQITDYRETHPTITRGLRRATTFLSLISLVALIVGALGVAMAIHSHLRMTGAWKVRPRGEPVPGTAWLVIARGETAEAALGRLFEHARRLVTRLAAGTDGMGNNLSFDQPTIVPPSHIGGIVHPRRTWPARRVLWR